MPYKTIKNKSKRTSTRKILRKREKVETGTKESLGKKKESIVSKEKYFYGIGRRKKSVAMIKIKEGKGNIVVNNKNFREYFPILEFQNIVLQSLKTVNKTENFDISADVRGGGKRGQAEACRLGIARALVSFDKNFKKPLKQSGLLTRDSRKKERKKYGLKKARRAPQFSKR